MGQTLELAPPPAPAEGEPMPTDLCWLLSRASYVLTTELTAALQELGISPRAHCVMSAALSGEHTQTELARMVGLDKTTMVVTLDELESAGLAERIRAKVLEVLPPADREVFLASLTKLVSQRLTEPTPCAQPVRRRAPRG